MGHAVTIRIAMVVASSNSVAAGSLGDNQGPVTPERAYAVLTVTAKVHVIDWGEDWKMGSGMESLDESASGILLRWIRYVLQESFTCTVSPIWKS
jgi:hypothetical protein